MYLYIEYDVSSTHKYLEYEEIYVTVCVYLYTYIYIDIYIYRYIETHPKPGPLAWHPMRSPPSKRQPSVLPRLSSTRVGVLRVPLNPKP